MKSFRLNRLFNAQSGRCFDVAIDHGFFNQPGFLQGIEDMPKVLQILVDAAPDAIQLTVGQARHLQNIRGRQKPSLVLRTDVANVYGKELPKAAFSLMIEDTMLQAVRHDAACVCVNLFQIPGAPEVHAQCVANILKLKPQADYYGMPMMVEPLVFQPNEKAGGYMVDGDLTKIMHLVRQAVELGADVIKADPTDDVSVYHKVIETAGGIPVLAAARPYDDEVPVLVIGDGRIGLIAGRRRVYPDLAAAHTAVAAVHEIGGIDAAAGTVLAGARPRDQPVADDIDTDGCIGLVTGRGRIHPLLRGDVGLSRGGVCVQPDRRDSRRRCEDPAAAGRGEGRIEDCGPRSRFVQPERFRAGTGRADSL